MSQHEHHHGKEHHHVQEHAKKGVHRQWWFWAAVILMLAGMFMYVATMDEALGPGGQVNPEGPADAE